jgi:predicted CxxxxCH...CXXCH cytochrome family protein
MPSLKKRVIVGLLLIAGMILIAGCGSSKKNDSAPFDADKGQHPENWLTSGHPAAAQADSSVCMECHGDDFSGGISRVACSSCHTNGNPLTVTNCASCHGKPPAGTAAPNRTGAHNTTTGHFAPAVVLQDSCNTCHNGAGTGTVNHYNGVVDIQFLSTYSAKSGTAVFNADGTCSKVSCHGGQTTPNWYTGSINVATQCTSCHAYGTSEYNSFSSGQHDFHVNTMGKACIVCHDTAKLSLNHFTALNTTALEGPASATIGNLVTNYSTTTHICSTLCHVDRAWF